MNNILTVSKYYHEIFVDMFISQAGISLYHVLNPFGNSDTDGIRDSNYTQKWQGSSR